MPIRSNASPDEILSPFYKENEALCHKWEKFVLNKGGQINGLFNASSFSIKSKIKSHHTWLVDVKKATYSNGFLLFSSKYQNLQEILIFRTLIHDTGSNGFLIRNSRLRRGSKDNQFAREVIKLLKEGFQNESLYEVLFRKSELRITFHHKNDWFDMAENIIDFNYTP